MNDGYHGGPSEQEEYPACVQTCRCPRWWTLLACDRVGRGGGVLCESGRMQRAELSLAFFGLSAWIEDSPPRENIHDRPFEIRPKIKTVQ